MLFKKIISVYTENHMKSININTESLIFKAAGTYWYNSTSTKLHGAATQKTAIFLV
jgi:hypothetical protein